MKYPVVNVKDWIYKGIQPIMLQFDISNYMITKKIDQTQIQNEQTLIEVSILEETKQLPVKDTNKKQRRYDNSGICVVIKEKKTL